MKKCPQCNTQCDDAKIYCPNCGNLLKTVAPPQPQPQPQPTPQPMPPKKKKSVLIPILLACSVALSVICLAAVYFNIKDGNYYRELEEDAYGDFWLQGRDYYTKGYDYNFQLVNDYYDFFNENARIVPDDGSGKYHRYWCKYLDEDAYFKIYNSAKAITYAEPCYYCCHDDN